MELERETNGGEKSKSPLNEKYEGLSQEELYDEILRQYKNLEVFKPSIEENPMELQRVGPGVVGAARDLIEAVNRFIKQGR